MVRLEQKQSGAFRWLVASTFAASSALALCPGAAEACYSLTDLGNLGGYPFNSVPRALNRKAQVVGFSSVPFVENGGAFLWDARTGMVSLGVLPGGGTSDALGINDQGVVVGGSTTVLFGLVYQRGFVWSPRRGFVDVGTLGGSNSGAKAINQRNQVVGIADTAAGEQHAFLWERGRMIDLGTLGGDYSEARSINEKGIIAGRSSAATGFSRPFVWRRGTMTDLGTLGGDDGEAADINDHGDVVGQSSLTPGDTTTHAALWTRHGIVDLGTLGGRFSFAAAISDAREIVGSSEEPDGVVRGFLWANGVIHDLDAELCDHDYRLSIATDINEHGQIVAFAQTPTGPFHAVLLEEHSRVCTGR
jgi:probable HAF family extracellular repeat protein